MINQVNELKPTEKKIYETIISFSKKKNDFPTLNQLNQLTGKSLSSILFILKDLGKRGLIKFIPNTTSISSLPLEQDLIVKQNLELKKFRNILSKNQKALHDFLISFIRDNNRSPLIREIMRYFGFTSSASVHKFINILELKGYILKGKRGDIISSVMDLEVYDIEETSNSANNSEINFKDLTERQIALYNYIKNFIKKEKYSPLLKDMSDFMNFKSPASTFKYLNSLERKGYIKRGVRGTLITDLPKEESLF